MSEPDSTPSQTNEEANSSTAHFLLSSGVRFDGLFIIISLILMVGLALDFRVHAEGVSFADESFWTNPHLLVYFGGAGIATLLVGTIIAQRRAGDSWIEAIPIGYALGLAGLVLFGVSGAADFVWHTAISHEDTALEGVTSPPHVGLATGGALFLSSPLRAAWRRQSQPTDYRLLPALLSLSFVLSIVVVFAVYLNPLAATQILDTPRLGVIMGLSAMVTFPLILLGTSLTLLRRFSLPPGALTVTFLVPGLVSVGTNGYFVLLIPLVITTVIADLFVMISPPTFDRPRLLRLFGLLVPITFSSVYFAVLSIWYGLEPVWTTHLWTGGVVISGLSGLLFTYALLPDSQRY